MKDIQGENDGQWEIDRQKERETNTEKQRER